MRLAILFALCFILSTGRALCAPSEADLQELQAQLEEERRAQSQMHKKAQNIAVGTA